ncbi:MAG: SGNH/GDSL hydrolase family protein [Elusimicrobia bacterium]|nr:SGNH/GDSL hydrolase family protein [Elusimicrobiota bacterium]
MRAAENEYHATTNDLGWRAPGPIPLRKPPGTLRVLVLGGSAMFGVGAQDGHTAPDHLERILNADPRTRPPGITRIEVLNAAQGWYGSTQELVHFVTDLWRYEPDIVLVVDGYNDIHHSLVWGISPPLTSVVVQHVNQMRTLPGFSAEAGWEHVVAAMIGASALRRTLHFPFELFFSLADQRLGSADLLVTDSHISEDAVFRTLLANWAALDAIARRDGFRVHFALQPVIFTKKPQSPQEAGFIQQAPYAQAVGDAWGHLEAYVARKAPAYGLDVFASDRYVRTVPDPIFGDHCHMDSRGYERAARAMAEVVRRDLKDWPWKTAFVRGSR